MWESGRPLSPDLAGMWLPDQPNNVGAGGEHCAEVWKSHPAQTKPAMFNDMPCDSALDGGKFNFVCQKRSTNTDLMEVTSDGVTFETMDTKLPSNDEIGTHGIILRYLHPFSSHARSLSSCHRQ